MSEVNPNTCPPGHGPARRLPARRAARIGLALIAASALGCRAEMIDQPRYETFEASRFFDNGMSARPLVPGTVARGWSRNDPVFESRDADGNLLNTFPMEVDEVVLTRGMERYNIYCTPCHGEVGDGKGMIVQRGFSPPPTFHEDRLRDIPVGHFYEVITNGYGAMYSYSHRIKPRDRWAIAAYIRALQLSQNAEVTEIAGLSEQEIRQQITAQEEAAAEAAAHSEGEEGEGEGESQTEMEAAE